MKGPTVSHPFEDPGHDYLVLINGEGQYSLWPEFADLPQGWRIVLGPESRSACTAHIDRNWLDMRPASLAAAATGD